MTDTAGARSAAEVLGHNLRELRAAAGLTQAAVASATGLSTTHYAGLERGSSSNGSPANPRLTTLLLMCTTLNCTLPELLKGIDPPA